MAQYELFLGKVITVNKVKNTPNPHSYIIEGEDEKTYLVHVGDIKENGEMLYELYKSNKTARLKEGDSVEFQADKSSDHAIHVKRIS